MSAAERVGRLVEILRRDGRVDVADAAAELGVTDMTIRRDLDALADRGVARRVRGGAVSTLMRAEELPFAMREIDATDVKRRLGTAVASLISDGESIVLDSGTTALEVARALAGRRLTVMPMSLHAASALAGQTDTRLIMPGGEVRPGELAMVGPLAQATIGALRFDTAVLGCCGVTDNGNVTAHDLGDAAVKKTMFTSAARRVLVMDGTKFAREALAVVYPVSAFDIVVTDASAPADMIYELRDQGVVVHSV